MDNAYNLLIKTDTLGNYNVFGLTEEQVKKAADAYLNGEDSFTVKGQKCPIKGVSIFKIYDHTEVVSSREDSIKHYINNVNFYKRNIFKRHYLPEETLQKMGKDVTHDFIGDNEYGANETRYGVAAAPQIHSNFVHVSRITELEKIRSADFDLTRLIQLCKEINWNHSQKNYLTVAILGRAIIDHVPPIFGFKKFDEVASQFGGQSFKKNMANLNVSMRSISDRNLHETISKKEVLPNETTVNFSQDLDVLLAEIVKKLS